jgi:hypothetical protein
LDRAQIARVLRNKKGNIRATTDVLHALADDDDDPTSDGDRQQQVQLL